MLHLVVNIIMEMIWVRKKETNKKSTPSLYGSVIELTENRKAVVDGCKFIINYDENAIEIKLSEMCVRFIGRDLVMSSLIYNQAVITGEISGIEFFSI